MGNFFTFLWQGSFKADSPSLGKLLCKYVLELNTSDNTLQLCLSETNLYPESPIFRIKGSSLCHKGCSQIGKNLYNAFRYSGFYLNIVDFRINLVIDLTKILSEFLNC